jgi:hypothetical protein
MTENKLKLPGLPPIDVISDEDAMAEATDDPWNEGFTAHMYGEPAASNPYDALSVMWYRWRAGWEDREEHQRAKAVCFPGW